MYYSLVVIFVLLNLSCSASPIPSLDQNQDEKAALLPTKNNALSAIQQLYEFNDLKMLCEIYGHCNDDDDQEMIDYEDPKHKRLSSSLFHGIPKFGKRAFSSAFAGIPKFG
jgi:hypothetical protein